MNTNQVESVVKATDNVQFMTGGIHGLVWQIVWTFCYDGTDRIMFVGPPFKNEDSLSKPNADMIYEMKRCKARAAIESVKLNTEAEAELKYAAIRALQWMLGAQKIEETKSWIDPVLIRMLEAAISHSSAAAVQPSPLETGPQHCT